MRFLTIHYNEKVENLVNQIITEDKSDYDEIEIITDTIKVEDLTMKFLHEIQANFIRSKITFNQNSLNQKFKELKKGEIVNETYNSREY